MWEYHGGFGVVEMQGEQAVPDEATLRALGLSMRNHQSADHPRSGSN
jgi:hypothetical protein